VLVTAAESADEDQSLGVKLLTDIRSVFDARMASFIASPDLISALRQLEDSPWNDFEYTARKLAAGYGSLGLGPRITARRRSAGVGSKTWRMLSSGVRPDTSERPKQQANGGFATDGSKATDGSIRPDETIRPTESPGQTMFSDGWTDADDTPGGNRPFTPPAGPGRCPQCGLHIETQGHRDNCPAKVKTP
jgi:hypothetical protein